MPVSTEAPRCSEFARSIDVLPPGSGLFLDRVVLISVPLPWPKPALAHDMLGGLAPLLQASAVRTRLFAMEPTTPHVVVEVYERSGASTLARQWTLGVHNELTPLISALAKTDLGRLDTVTVDGVEDTAPMHLVPPTFLVCTQGSHDSCCGTSGVALADEITNARPDYVVRRVSHTGGHRFSPTFLALPSGRMWAFADLELVDRVANGHVTAHDFVHHARGWWGAKVGAAQVAENAVRAEHPDLVNLAASVVATPAADGEASTSFAVTVGEHSWQVDVRVARTIPTIACEAPGGLPAKPGREFSWSIAPR